MAEQQSSLRVIPTRQRITQLPPAAVPSAEASSEAQSPQQTARPGVEPPKTPQEAQQRFFARYSLEFVAALLELPRTPHPKTVADWTRLAEWTRDVLSARKRVAEAMHAIQQAQAKAHTWTNNANQPDTSSDGST